MDFFRETQRYLAQFHNAHTEFVDNYLHEGRYCIRALRTPDRRQVGDNRIGTRRCKPGDVIRRIEDQRAHDFLRP
jgi:hypothetical protein